MAHEFKVRNGLIVGVVSGTTAVDRILDEDDLVSDSNTALATQQSIKAYIDALDATNVGTAGTGVAKGYNGTTREFEFYKLNSLSANLTINLDSGNNKIDFDLAMIDFDFQASVLDIYDPTTSTPPTPTTGDRYISAATANGWTIDNIYEWSGTAWTETVANEGMLTWVEDEDKFYVYNGSAWVTFGGIVAHNSLSGLQGGAASEYYHLDASDYGDLTDVNAQLAALQTDGTPTFANLISSGYARIGDTTDTTGGNLRYNSNTFQGYDGSTWVDLHAADDDMHSLTAVTTIADDDEILIYDTSNSGYRKITKANLFAGFSGNSGEVTNITAATTIDSFADTAHKAAEWDYVVQDGTNYRSGTVYAVWNATADTVEYAETSTIDIGDTSPVVLSVDIDTDTVRLRCTPASGTWVLSYNRENIG